MVHSDRSDKEFRLSLVCPLTLFPHTTFVDHIAQRKQREQRSGATLQALKAHPSYTLPPVHFHILRVQLPPQAVLPPGTKEGSLWETLLSHAVTSTEVYSS